MQSPVFYGLKTFDDLQTSTMTIMVYSNAFFNREKLFKGINITEVPIPLTKKQKNVDKKKIEAPYGSIISVQKGTRIRGIDLRKKKKHWCTVCQPMKVWDDKERKINTVTESLHTIPDTDIKKIMYDCSRCEKSYPPRVIHKINHFLNQLTVVISIDKKPLLNMMVFKDNIKIAGCKTIDDAMEAVLIFWQDYVTKIKDGHTLKPKERCPKFVFEVVMRNVDFKLGFPIERSPLNILMNSPEFSDKIFMSQYESTGHTNVNIKMYSRKPEDHTYDCLVLPEGKDPRVISIKDNPYKSDKKKQNDDKKTKYTTFIVFSSSEIILSGRYNKNMEQMYNFFVDLAFKNKSLIEEKITVYDKTKKVRIGS